MEDFRREHPRLIGFILFIAGLGGAGYAINAYNMGSEIQSFFIVVFPLCLIYGIAVMIEPRITLSYKDYTIDRRFKLGSIVLMMLCVILGFYVRLVVFKNWR